MGPGFIHDALDLKILILYIMAHTEGPVDFAALTDLTFCDDGVDYFSFAQAAGELVSSGHLSLEDGLYVITEKGKANSAIMESSLPGVVRNRVAKSLTSFNAQARRDAQITAQVCTDAGRPHIQLGLLDGETPLFSLTAPVASPEQGEAIARRFRARPEALFTAVLALLNQDNSGEEEGA